jgi:hypothetical protein
MELRSIEANFLTVAEHSRAIGAISEKLNEEAARFKIAEAKDGKIPEIGRA